MSYEDKVWKFSYEMRNGKTLEGTFVACEEQIEWIVGKVINFGDTFSDGLDTVIRMEAELFTLINSDYSFANQFQAAIGVTGVSPFHYLNEEQSAEHGLEFEKTYVEGKLVKIIIPKEDFIDEGYRVITYEITNQIFFEDEGEGKFDSEFEVVQPDTEIYYNHHVLSYSSGGFDCLKIIRRKLDGQLFGYPYEVYRDDSHYYPNGEKHGFKNSRSAYVWENVQAAMTTSYHISAE